MGYKRFITISGNIGSGKTTLTSLLADRYRWKPHYEAVTENPYLPDFYRDMRRWSLQLQVYFLSKRFQAHQEITRSEASGIQDRSIYEDAHIFARGLHESGLMEARDFENYLGLYSTMTQFLTPPDLVVYVRRSVKSLRGRIALRGREYERGISDEYLALLNHCYDDWVANYKLGKTLTIEADDLDPKNTPEHFDYICNSIENSLEQPDLVYHC